MWAAQISVRQNLLSMQAQYCEREDLARFVVPTLLLTAVASALGFLSTSSAVGAEGYKYNMAALITGVVVQVT